MESIQENLSTIFNTFQTRMADFETQIEDLKKPNAPPTIGVLAADFVSFKSFILEALNLLQKQVSHLAFSVDNMEMYNRRKFLLLHGVPEVEGEDVRKVLVNIIQTKLMLSNFSTENIRRCHRMGQPRTTQSPRPILFKLTDENTRDRIWYLKTKLKGSGYTMSEFLTKARHDLFMTARNKCGITKCWTKSGSVYIVDSNNIRKRITSVNELNDYTSQESKDNPKRAPTNIKTRRGVTSKK